METLRGFIIGLLLFMSVVIGLGGLYTELGSTYNVTINDSFTNTFDQISNITGTAETAKGQVEPATADTDSQAWASTGILSVIKLPFNLLGIVHNFVIDIVDRANIPHWAIGVIYTAMFIIPLVFIIASALAKWRT